MSTWTLRTVTRDDHDQIVAVGQAEDIAFRGFTDLTDEMVTSHMQGASTFDWERDQVIAEVDGAVAGYAVLVPKVVIIMVDPEHESAELRGALLDWAEHRERELDWEPYRVAAFAMHLPARQLYRDRGYTLQRLYSKMVRTFATSGPPEPATLADGYVMRRIDRESDAVALHDLNERAFAEREDHTPEPLEDYVKQCLLFDQFDPAWSLIVTTPDGEAVASCIGWRPPDHPHGYVAILAVDPGHRRHGLGRALLLSAFAAIHAADLPAAELFVASDNPKALGLYTGVGMAEDERMEHYVRTP